MKIQLRNEGKVKKEDAIEGAVGKAVKNRQPRKFHYDCENFAGIAKIS